MNKYKIHKGKRVQCYASKCKKHAKVENRITIGSKIAYYCDNHKHLIRGNIKKWYQSQW